MRTMTLLAAALAAVAGPAARAATVEATSTTLLYTGQQSRGGTPGAEPDLVTVAPAFEILTVSARGMSSQTGDLEVQLSTWGSWELSARRWDAGTTSDFNGDILTGFVQGRLLDRRLTIRVGRETVALGATRFVQIDGGDVVLRLPFGFGLSAYAGSPVSQRFQSRSGLRSWNPAGGDLAYGGRVSWALAVPGAAGRGLEIGAFVSEVKDGSQTARNDVGGDLRIQVLGNLTLSGYGIYALEEDRLAEATALLTWTATRKLHVNADVRYSAPDLMLPRTSILSVFADSDRTDFGGGATYEFTRAFEGGADAHVLLEPGETAGSTYTGYEVAVHGRWHRGATTLGGEVSVLDALDNGYWALRLFGRHELGRAFATADVQGHFFRDAVNGQDYALIGSVSVGTNLGGLWSVVVAGRAGVNPFFEQQYDAMAKLVYNQTYVTRQVR
jgi:hypothetical protein